MWTVIIALVMLTACIMLATWQLVSNRHRITVKSAKTRKFGMLLTVLAVAVVMLVLTKTYLFGLIVVFPIGWAFLAAISTYTASAVVASTQE